jgi:hypothetical protein
MGITEGFEEKKLAFLIYPERFLKMDFNKLTSTNSYFI